VQCNVGLSLARMFKHAGRQSVIADVNESRLRSAAKELSARGVDPGASHRCPATGRAVSRPIGPRS